MRRSAGIVTAACGLGASAFVLPQSLGEQPGITVLEQHTRHLLVALPCSQCAFSQFNLGNKENVNDADGNFYIQGGSYNVVVNYTVSDDGRSFGYSGRNMVPLTLAEMDGSAYVNQVPSAASIADIEDGLAATVPLEVTMDYWSSLDGLGLEASEEGSMEIGHHIVGLNGQTVSLSEVKIRLSRDSQGRYEIEGAQLGASRDELMTAPWRGDIDDALFLPFPEKAVGNVPAFKQGLDADENREECRMPAALCRIKAMLLSKINAARRGGCPGRKGAGPTHGGRLPTHIKPHFTRPGHDEIPRPHHVRPHHHHRRPHHRHRHDSLHAFGRGLAAILVPTLAGVAVGMTAGLVGLIVGRLIGFLWIKLVRGGRRGDAGNIMLTEEFHEVEPEKESLMAEMEAPPVYEEVVPQDQAADVSRDE